jgi:hypothetical protein
LRIDDPGTNITKRCVPVRANGFKDLDLRVKSQEKQVLLFRTELHNIQEKLNAIQSRHDLTTSIKLEDCRRRHVALARRALSLAAKVQVLKNRGYALQPEEETLKKRLEGLAKLVQDPAAAGRMNEIWARMMVVQEKARAMEESMGKVEIVWDENQLQTAGRVSSLSYVNKLKGNMLIPCSYYSPTLTVSVISPKRSLPSKSHLLSGRSYTRPVMEVCKEFGRGFLGIDHCYA